MNDHEARQTTTGEWNWTTMNDRVVRTAPPCAWPDFHDWPSNPMAKVEPTGRERCDHATREEAERHFYDDNAANLREVTYTGAFRCQGPHEGEAPWTNKALSSRYLGDAQLCDEHRDEAGWRAVHPFSPGIRITASW